MPTKYALPCPHCDELIEVETRQAGQQITCDSCQKEAEAPRLGQLKRLAAIEDASELPKERKSGGLFVIGLLLFVLAGIAGGFLIWHANNLIVDYNVMAAMEMLDEYDDTLSTFQLATIFDKMNVDDGLGDWKEQPHVALTRQGHILLYIAYGLLSISGIGLILMVMGLFKK